MICIPLLSVFCLYLSFSSFWHASVGLPASYIQWHAPSYSPTHTHPVSYTHTHGHTSTNTEVYACTYTHTNSSHIHSIAYVGPSTSTLFNLNVIASSLASLSLAPFFLAKNCHASWRHSDTILYVIVAGQDKCNNKNINLTKTLSRSIG